MQTAIDKQGLTRRRKLVKEEKLSGGIQQPDKFGDATGNFHRTWSIENDAVCAFDLIKSSQAFLCILLRAAQERIDEGLRLDYGDDRLHKSDFAERMASIRMRLEQRDNGGGTQLLGAINYQTVTFSGLRLPKNRARQSPLHLPVTGMTTASVGMLLAFMVTNAFRVFSKGYHAKVLRRQVACLRKEEDGLYVAGRSGDPLNNRSFGGASRTCDDCYGQHSALCLGIFLLERFHEVGG